MVTLMVPETGNFAHLLVSKWMLPDSVAGGFVPEPMTVASTTVVTPDSAVAPMPAAATWLAVWDAVIVPLAVGMALRWPLSEKSLVVEKA